MPQPESLPQRLAANGVSRRDFNKFCATMVALLALPERYVAQVTQALSRPQKPVLVWLEFQDCAGNTESMLRSSNPTVAAFVLDLLSWEYHETIMAGAGHQAEAVLDGIVKNHRGEYITVVEGSIPTAENGIYCTIAGRTALDIVRTVCAGSAVNIAVGACAWDGGLPAAHPNPTGAVGLEEAVPGVPVVNLGGCPHNPENTAALLVHYLTFDKLPPLDQFHRPLFAYGNLIHDQCERRAHFDAGEFVETWDDEGARKGWCLYKMGCKGPEATYNCPTVRWNDGVSWPVRSGHGCIACASNHFWDTKSPFYRRLPTVPGFPADVTAEQIGWVALGAMGAAAAAQSIGSAVRKKIRPSTEAAADSHPDESPAPPPPVHK